MASRDPRFDGRFVVAVTSTRIYCRPICPSRTPKRENTRFFPVPETAEAAGFRACLRCSPRSAPDSPGWDIRGDLVARALRLIEDGLVDEVGVTGLAGRLAVSERHLHRQLTAEVGAGPQALALSRRARVARLLIESRALPLTEVAFAAGYASVRQFNHGIRAAFGCTPGELRGPGAAGDGQPLTLRLGFRPPLPAVPLLDWFDGRTLTGVETVRDGEYRRTLRLPRSTAWIALRIGAAQATLRLGLTDLRDLATAVRRCRELFDLDADPDMISDVLRPDPLIGPLDEARPGLRIPGHVDGLELAVRTVLGPRERTLGARLVSRWGQSTQSPEPGLTHLFPTPQALADADLESAGVPERCAIAIRALACAVHDGTLRLDRDADREQTAALLCRLPGLTPKKAARITRHALGDPDAFPLDDPRLREAVRLLGGDPRRLGELADRWRPWRSYAAMHLRALTP